MLEVKNKESPFTPGKPVPIEYFVARLNEIQRLERAIRQTATGRNENVFITGERGIGKSSLAAFIRYFAEREYNFIGIHCYLGGIRDLEGMIRIICQRLLQETTDKTILDKLQKIFSKYIRQLTLFGIGIEFTTDKSELRILLDNFLPLMRNINNIIRENQKRGMVLILDDLNGITGISDFAHFLKSFVDELATSKESLPILLILVGISYRREDLIKYQPSIARIFNVIELSPMQPSEVTEFFRKTFGDQNIYISDDILSKIVQLTGGLPMLMHEVGDAIFWEDTDNFIDINDANRGIINAVESIGKKYLEPQIYQVMRSRTYRTILRKIGELPLGTNFLRKDMLEKMSEKEQKSFDNFLRRMKKLGVITEGEIRGEYRFINQLYHFYILLEGVKAEIQGKHSC
jgi:AAA+ ATPase superfamily predicted ATPase